MSGRRGACPATTKHPLLTELAKDKRLQMVGINYKDAPTTPALSRRYGNPFGVVGVDGKRRGLVEWGVYGVPETLRGGTRRHRRLQAGRPGRPRIRQRAQDRDREGAESGVVTLFLRPECETNNSSLLSAIHLAAMAPPTNSS